MPFLSAQDASASLRRSARLAPAAVPASSHSHRDDHSQLHTLPASQRPSSPTSLESESGPTTRKRNSTEGEIDERMRKRLRIQSSAKIGSPPTPLVMKKTSEPKIQIQMGWKGGERDAGTCVLPKAVLWETLTRTSGVTVPWITGPGTCISYSANANAMDVTSPPSVFMRHVSPHWSVPLSAAQEGHDDLPACDLLHPYAFLLNHSEHPRVQQQPVGGYFQHFYRPPLISLRVAILKNTYRDAAVSVLGRGMPVDPARMAAWGGKRRREIQARDAGNGVLQRRRGTPTARTAMRSGLAGEEQPALAGRQMPGVGRGTPVDPVRRAAWSG
ncbi:hypothetical protein B0H13DRAFT_1979153 [Mycena leptocephala]|nr:hypothetical protein B0H13DRAFT_1979153 [Mycena leptocephala]